MQKIEIKKIIKERDLDTKQVAQQLFPKHRYPILALQRIMKREGVLDADQISKLALMAQVSISELFGRGEWKSRLKGNTMTLTCSNFVVELDTKTWVTRIFDKESLFHESIIHDGATPVSAYLIQINKIINDYKNPQHEKISKTNTKKRSGK